MKGSFDKPVHLDYYNTVTNIGSLRFGPYIRADGKDYESAWEFNLSKNLPFFTPGGHYKVQVEGFGNIQGSSE